MSDDFLQDYKNELQTSLDQFFEQPLKESFELILSTLASKQSIFIAGNGGSASISDHFATDWSKGINQLTNFNIRVKSLTSNSSIITATGNDLGFENIFKNQLKIESTKGDLLVLISSSGKSKNIIQAADFAKKTNLEILILTSTIADLLLDYSCRKLIVKSNNIQIIEDIHSIYGHLFLNYIKNKFNEN